MVLKDFGGIVLKASKRVARFGIRLLKLPFTAIRIALGALFTPIGLLATAFIAAGVLIYKFWEPIKAFFVGFAEGFKQAFEPIFSTVSGAFEPLKPIFEWFKAVFSDIFSQTKLISDEFESAKNAGVAFGQMVANAINLILAPIKWVINGLETITNLAAEAFKGFDFSTSNFNPLNWFGSNDEKPSTKGAIDAHNAQKANALNQTNTKTQTINDYKTINITQHSTSATPAQTAKAVQNASYSFND